MAKIDRRTVTFGLALTGVLGISAACSRGSSAQARSESSAPRVPPDLYVCEGCEATRERDSASLSSTAMLAGPDEPGERLRLDGRVFAVDGVTPVEGVVIYAHHTNIDGLYANGTEESEWSRRNGRLRGWVTTDAEGRYAFDTIKPAPYPARTLPAHIHLYMLEPGRPPYYIDDVVFAGEFMVNSDYRAAQQLRGGSGIIELKRSEGAWLARRDIRLEPHPG